MQAYQWIREGWTGKRWHLLQGDHRVATLERRGWGLSYDLHLGGGTWTVRAEGFWTQRLVLVDPQGLRRLEARVRGRGADVTGHAWGPMAWRATSWWRATYELQAHGHGAPARFRARSARGEAQADPRLPDAVPLLALGWAVHLVLQMNGAVAATASTSAVAAAT